MNPKYKFFVGLLVIILLFSLFIGFFKTKVMEGAQTCPTGQRFNSPTNRCVSNPTTPPSIKCKKPTKPVADLCAEAIRGSKVAQFKNTRPRIIETNRDEDCTHMYCSASDPNVWIPYY
jgi:hypothetical protein